MDIEYLLFLQNFRNSINDALTPFMENISLFATAYIFLLPAFVYWSINKRKGLYIISSMSVSLGFNAVLKLTACVYRPWIRDPRIIPAGDSIATAGGYSFPSGHTATATPIYGGLAVLSRNIVRFFWVALILLTMFSRNYLGVHTPQDVIVGLLVGVAALYLTAKIFAYIEKHREKENLFLIAGFLAGIIALIYINVKSYPMDYVDGKLLVEPSKMIRSGLADIAMILALTLGRYIERRWIKFSPAGFNFRGIILSIIGIVIFGAMLSGMKSFFIAALGSHLGRFVNGFVMVFYVVAIWPFVLKLCTQKK